jgi:hypothetical protein
LNIEPSFASFKRLDDTPQAGVTTFELAGQGLVTTTIRLVDVVEIDGVALANSSARVSFDIDVHQSQLVLKFGYFNSTLLYDPGTLLLHLSCRPL